MIGEVRTFVALYGVWLWAAVGVLAAISPLVAMRLRRRSLRRLHELADRSKGRAGRLVADEPIESFHDQTPMALSQRYTNDTEVRFADGLRLATMNDTFRLKGPFRIESGHREVRRSHIRDIRLGHFVRILGELSTPSEPAAYRDELTLEGSESEPLRILSAGETEFHPKPGVRCLVAGTVFLLASFVVGVAAVELHFLTVAVAIPTSRDDAIEEIANACCQLICSTERNCPHPRSIRSRVAYNGTDACVVVRRTEPNRLQCGRPPPSIVSSHHFHPGLPYIPPPENVNSD
ncbi:MAG: hypothetical protein AAGE52_11775 [Myxococcota bacterium]